MPPTAAPGPTLYDICMHPLEYLAQHWPAMWAVVKGDPMSAVAVLFTVVLATWFAAYLYYKNRLDQVATLKERLDAKNDDITRLKESLAKKDQELAQLREHPPISASLPLFFPQYRMHDFLARTTGRGIVHFDSVSPQEVKSLLLRITVTFMAVPDVEVEQVYLEVMNKRLPSFWKPQKVRHGMETDVAFDIPPEVNAGFHTLKLIAVGPGFEKASPEFQIDFPPT